MPEGDEFLVELVAKDIVIKYKGIKYVRSLVSEKDEVYLNMVVV